MLGVYRSLAQLALDEFKDLFVSTSFVGGTMRPTTRKSAHSLFISMMGTKVR